MRRSGYTLIEVLIVVTILGIAAAAIVPTMGDAGVLRVQAAVRTIIADISTAQSEALAYQQGRAIKFYPTEGLWKVIEVKGNTIDPGLNTLWSSHFAGGEMGDSRIEAVDFNDTDTLIFDELGGPVTSAGGSTPAPTGTVTVVGSGQKFVVEVQGYTGRIDARRVSP